MQESKKIKNQDSNQILFSKQIQPNNNIMKKKLLTKEEMQLITCLWH